MKADERDLQGYYREPTLHGDHLVFVCEQDLWSVSTDGGSARRLTANIVDPSSPFLSPDGEGLAFVGREEGASEVYVMPARGGRPQRLTYQGSFCIVLGWSPDGERILFGSYARRATRRSFRLWTIPWKGGAPEQVRWGPVDRISYGSEGRVVIGRHVGDPARWKRYRGGRTGSLWIDPQGKGEFDSLITLEGNLANPMWIGERVYFISDHEGHGNIYSCTPDGQDLRRHTHHEDFYARNATTDGKRIVYQSGARIHLLDPDGDETRRVDIEVASSKPQLTRRFVSAARYLEDCDVHPRGHSLALTIRGKPYTMGNWEQAVTQHGERDGVRYRMTRWLHDGKRLLTVSDAGGEEAVEVHPAGAGDVVRLSGLDIGRAIDIAVSPTADRVAIANHRYELLLVDLEAKEVKVLDSSDHGRVKGMAWSADGRWLAYGFMGSTRTSHIRVVDPDEGTTHELTQAVHVDSNPCFDPEGKYLYFVSYRTFNPVYDRLYFDLGFPQGGRPYLIPLQKELQSPFRPEPKSLFGDDDAKKDDEKKDEKKKDGKKKDKKEKKKKKGKGKGKGKGKDKKEDDGPKKVDIHFEGIERRVVAFPVEEAIYGHLIAIKNKVLYDRWPIEGSLGKDWLADPEPKGQLYVYDLEEQKEEHYAAAVSGFSLGLDGKTLVYASGRKLRVVKAEAKPAESTEEKLDRSSGWIDLSRPRVSVVPTAEWSQMYREAWRLQRDQFWTPDMSKIDWEEVYERYLPVLERVATRSEFSDLMWEVQGELGTSHAYEIGGDHPRHPPPHGPGHLAADLALEDGHWVFSHLVRGDCWNPDADSPLNAPGLNVTEGDRLLAVDGVAVGPERAPEELLVNRAGADVTLTVQRDEEEPRTVTIRTLRGDFDARYREWVETNRAKVHEATGGRLGYLHVPNMGPWGYSEFHRYYQQEIDRDALLVDVRDNGGGHVSQLLLEKLARKRLGYDVPRYGVPVPYPEDSVLGPIVCLTNEGAGSDGDIFSHCFKLMKLGPLIGTRTWGGVIGIWPRHHLVDRTVTTQAEFAFWFHDVGFGVENYGTEPDIEVHVAPQDYAAGRDTQLAKGIEVALELLEKQKPQVPDFGERPSRRPPRLKR